MVVNSIDQKQGSTNHRCLRKVLSLSVDILAGSIFVSKGEDRAMMGQQGKFCVARLGRRCAGYVPLSNATTPRNKFGVMYAHHIQQPLF